jgi:hypothetical protein
MWMMLSYPEEVGHLISRKCGMSTRLPLIDVVAAAILFFARGCISFQ